MWHDFLSYLPLIHGEDSRMILCCIGAEAPIVHKHVHVPMVQKVQKTVEAMGMFRENSHEFPWRLVELPIFFGWFFWDIVGSNGTIHWMIVDIS